MISQPQAWLLLLVDASAKALRDDGLQPGERDLAEELAAENARKNVKDIFLNEAVNILGDELEEGLELKPVHEREDENREHEGVQNRLGNNADRG